MYTVLSDYLIPSSYVCSNIVVNVVTYNIYVVSVRYAARTYVSTEVDMLTCTHTLVLTHVSAYSYIHTYTHLLTHVRT
jgi:hypothetical protein